jgi:hypothetical protein
MNSIRDFWDTVVLRDVLGYIVPGAVTLLALGLLLLPLLVVPLAPRVSRFEMAAVLRSLLGSHKPWICSYLWLVAAIVIPLCFVIGHIQGQLVAFLGEKRCFRRWNLGFLALSFLKEDVKAGGKYTEAALEVLEGTDREIGLKNLCARHGDKWEALCCCLKQVRSNSGKGDRVQKAKEQARDLWYLCNHYVLNGSPHLHAMWIGRYYVLAVLFSNLLVSFFLLAVSVLLFLSCFGSHLINTGAHLRWLASQPVAVLRFVGLLVALIVGMVWMYALWVCSWQFHQAYVERTFPIFYVLSRPKGRRRRDNES